MISAYSTGYYTNFILRDSEIEMGGCEWKIVIEEMNKFLLEMNSSVPSKNSNFNIQTFLYTNNKNLNIFFPFVSDYVMKYTNVKSHFDQKHNLGRKSKKWGKVVVIN